MDRPPFNSSTRVKKDIRTRGRESDNPVASAGSRGRRRAATPQGGGGGGGARPRTRSAGGGAANQRSWNPSAEAEARMRWGSRPEPGQSSPGVAPVAGRPRMRVPANPPGSAGDGAASPPDAGNPELSEQLKALSMLTRSIAHHLDGGPRSSHPHGTGVDALDEMLTPKTTRTPPSRRATPMYTAQRLAPGAVPVQASADTQRRVASRGRSSSSHVNVPQHYPEEVVDAEAGEYSGEHDESYYSTEGDQQLDEDLAWEQQHAMGHHMMRRGGRHGQHHLPNRSVEEEPQQHHRVGGGQPGPAQTLKTQEIERIVSRVQAHFVQKLDESRQIIDQQAQLIEQLKQRRNEEKQTYQQRIQQLEDQLQRAKHDRHLLVGKIKRQHAGEVDSDGADEEREPRRSKTQGLNRSGSSSPGHSSSSPARRSTSSSIHQRVGAPSTAKSSNTGGGALSDVESAEELRRQLTVERRQRMELEEQSHHLVQNHSKWMETMDQRLKQKDRMMEEIASGTRATPRSARALGSGRAPSYPVGATGGSSPVMVGNGSFTAGGALTPNSPKAHYRGGPQSSMAAVNTNTNVALFSTPANGNGGPSGISSVPPIRGFSVTSIAMSAVEDPSQRDPASIGRSSAGTLTGGGAAGANGAPETSQMDPMMERLLAGKANPDSDPVADYLNQISAELDQISSQEDVLLATTSVGNKE